MRRYSRQPFFIHFMKFFARVIALFLISVSVQKVQAQLQVGVHGAYAIPTPKEEGVKNSFGGGIQARYFISPNLAAGLEASLLSSKYTQDYGWLGSYTYKSRSIPITPKIEYFFMDGPLRPYAGLKAGLYLANVSAEGESESESFFGFAPKVGLQYKLPQNLAVFLEGDYNFVLSKKAARDLGADTFGSKFVQLNLGLAYTLDL